MTKVFFGDVASATPAPELGARRAGRVVIAAAVMTMVAGLATSPRTALAGGINLAIPFNAPSLQSFQAAAIGTNNEGYADYFGLVPMSDASGNPLSVALPSGVSAITYLDPVGNVIVAYAWDATPAENILGQEIEAGYGPSLVPGYGDAVKFLQTVQAAAAAKNIPSSRIYLTGFSLGAMLASYVGSQTGLPGIAFASSGIPDYTAPATPASNFISFVEANDPIAQYGTDTLEAASVVAENPHMDHYGTVIPLGTLGAEEQQFAGYIAGYSLRQFGAGTVPGTPDQLASLQAEYYDLGGRNHQMSLYNPDTDALAQSYGINPTAP